MTTILLTIAGLLLLLAFVTFRILRGLLNSPLFWVAAVMATLIALPITAGMSLWVILGLILLRLVLLAQVFKAADRSAG